MIRLACSRPGVAAGQPEVMKHSDRRTREP